MNKSNTFYKFESKGKINTILSEELVNNFLKFFLKVFPHISVNIGSGVSVLQVDSISNVKRITGTLMGGGNKKI